MLDIDVRCINLIGVKRGLGLGVTLSMGVVVDVGVVLALCVLYK